ncbi:hypothetical protein [Pseudomonas sp. KK4]|uniref:hypothetical protein n=1 Tax=Pseudomonas sp. KK4 TaxID=1855729 RepID=UPI00097C2CC0|nr:hypothetical protein [Pseudomonas sp. KK4]
MPGPVFQKGTLLIPTGGSDHLHVVMNDPIHCPVHGHVVVLLVNISTVYPDKFHDTSCILTPGGHPFINRDSWVVYREAVISRVDRVENGVNQNVIRTHQPFQQNVFDQVRYGFDVSPHVATKITRFLKQHQI